MTPDPRPSVAATVCFSTEEYAERERLAALREVFGRAIVKLDIAPPPEVPFHARMEAP